MRRIRNTEKGFILDHNVTCCSIEQRRALNIVSFHIFFPSRCVYELFIFPCGANIQKYFMTNKNFPITSFSVCRQYRSFASMYESWNL